MGNQLTTYSFEYNETDGNFHQNFGDHTINANGYKTICEVQESIWRPFINMLNRRYDFCSSKIPSYEVIQKEWDDYLLLLEDISAYEDFN